MKAVAVLVASGFEQVELTTICTRLAEAGHRVVVVSTKKHDVRSWNNTRWSGDIPVDLHVTDADPHALEAVVVPGGLLSADTLRADGFAVELVRAVAARGGVIATMGHGAWMLAESGLAKGRAVTGHPAVRTDLVNAGGNWTDAPVAADGKVVSGRNTHDSGAFMAAVLRLL